MGAGAGGLVMQMTRDNAADIRACTVANGRSLRGLSGSCTANTATLFATTTETANNRLVKVVDSSTDGTTGTLTGPSPFWRSARLTSRTLCRPLR